MKLKCTFEKESLSLNADNRSVNSQEFMLNYITHIGLNGAKGDKGDRGDQGMQGIQGIQGAKGDRGEQGLQGTMGSAGAKGDRGDTGRDGNTGAMGKSAYELAVLGGYTGTLEQFTTEAAALANNSGRLAQLETDSQTYVTVDNGLRALYLGIGAVFNNNTGFYELNRLDNITEQQMANIYNYGRVIMSGCQETTVYGCQSSRNRTNWGVTYVQGEWTNLPNLQEAFRYNRFIETILIPFWSTSTRATKVKSLRFAFYCCDKLRVIISPLDISLCDNWTLQGAFLLCNNLEEVSLIKLNANISFENSPKLGRVSILYLINNSINTVPITLTLHATAAARLTSEDIAVASSKNITIA